MQEKYEISFEFYLKVSDFTKKSQIIINISSRNTVIQYVKDQFIYHLVIYDVPFGRAGRRARFFYRPLRYPR